MSRQVRSSGLKQHGSTTKVERRLLTTWPNEDLNKCINNKKQCNVCATTEQANKNRSMKM